MKTTNVPSTIHFSVSYCTIRDDVYEHIEKYVANHINRPLEFFVQEELVPLGVKELLEVHDEHFLNGQLATDDGFEHTIGLLVELGWFRYLRREIEIRETK